MDSFNFHWKRAFVAFRRRTFFRKNNVNVPLSQSDTKNTLVHGSQTDSGIFTFGSTPNTNQSNGPSAQSTQGFSTLVCRFSYVSFFWRNRTLSGVDDYVEVCERVFFFLI